MQITQSVRKAHGSQAHPATCSKPVDLVHLARYTLGNRELEQEVLELFSQQSVVYLARLCGAETDRDWREAAHTIKGSARAIGAWRLGNCAEQAEPLTNADGSAARKAAMADIEAALVEATAYIETLIAKA